MATQKKKSKTKAAVKFKDLKSKKNPKGGFGWNLKAGNVKMLNPQPLPP
jgi:predicted secreted protein